MKKADRELWHSVAAAVKPLKGKKNIRTAPATKVATKAAAVPTQTTIHPPPLPRRRLPDLTVGTGEAVDGALFHRLVAGKLPIAGRIDLHGMRQAEAQPALVRFLHFSHHNGRRCVLVITGKSGVLRQEVPRWLNEEAVRPLVLSITPAKPADGGSGALYVLLKRRR